MISYTHTKRLIDIILACIHLIVLAPIIIPIMIALRLTGEGYIWYKQERIGYKNQPFMIWKFATMLKDSPNMEGGIITTKKDPRITPLGSFLRKTKINEIPQLINILKGDMSFIGPRPVMRQSFEAYPKEIQGIIYNVKPGLSGIGSIIFRDEEELITEVKNRGEDTWDFYKNKIYPFKGRLEKWYQENQSPSTDFKLFLLTAWVVLFPQSDLPQRIFLDLPSREG